MSTQRVEILTPPGRLVMGNCFVPQTKDAEGNPLVIKSGPNVGKPRVDYYMGLAIPKTDPGYAELWGKIQTEARESFPALFDAAGACLSPKFAFKVIDGDSQIPNSKGNKPCDHEGFPGHWILNFSGGFAPKCYTAGGESVITDPDMIKRGYFIRIYGSVAGNGSQQQPGIFLNHSMVELIGYGDEIVTGPNGSAVFGAAPAALPAGASATPLAPATPLAAPAPAPAPGMVGPAPAPAPGMVGPAPGAVPGMAAPAPAPAPGMAAPAAPAAPAPDFLQPPVDFSVNVDGQVHLASALKAAGWTDEQISTYPKV